MCVCIVVRFGSRMAVVGESLSWGLVYVAGWLDVATVVPCLVGAEFLAGRHRSLDGSVALMSVAMDVVLAVVVAMP